MEMLARTTKFRWSPTTWVAIVITLVGLYLSVLVVMRHTNLQTAQYDLGNMEQVLWQTLHGRWFQMTDPVTGLHVPRTATHADFLLLLYTPFYFLWSDPRLLLILQVVFVVSGAWPLFLFARRKLTQRASAWLAVGYLFYPSLWWALMFDLHAVLLVMPLFVWAVWAATEKRWPVYWLSIVGLLLAKEEVGLSVGLLGLYLWWRERNRRVGLVTAVIGFAWSAVMIGYAIPHARQIPGHFALGYYSEFGTTLGQVGTNILSRPWEVLGKLFSWNGLGYETILLSPLAFISLLGLPLLLMALPELGINLLSSNPNLQSIYYQYTSGLTPFVFLAAVLGLATLQRWMKGRPRLHQAALATIFLAFMVNVYYWSPLPGTRHDRDGRLPFITSSYRPAVARAKALIGSEDKVAATNNLAAQFTGRDYTWAWPKALDQADVAVVLTGGDYEVLPKKDITDSVVKLQLDPNWQLLFQDRDFYFFRKRL